MADIDREIVRDRKEVKNLAWPSWLPKPQAAIECKNESKIEAESAEKSNVVRIPKSEIVVSPPLKAEAKAAGKFSNPVILLPLYALGGYLILNWGWRKWKERLAQRTDDSDENEDDEDDNHNNY